MPFHLLIAIIETSNLIFYINIHINKPPVLLIMTSILKITQMNLYSVYKHILSFIIHPSTLRLARYLEHNCRWMFMCSKNSLLKLLFHSMRTSFPEHQSDPMQFSST